jgi:ABC-type nitrate/sulfonate/bicarbonate transport system ATPase subunit
MSGLEVSITRKRYRGAVKSAAPPIIEDLHFVVPERQCLCLVGPSGCGKTTLLNIVSGLDKDVDGEIRLDGGDRAAPPIGYMFQSPRLMPWLTVRENVRLALPQPSTMPDAAERLLGEMQLEAVLDAYPGQLSGGMQRRVALARAFVNEPRLLLLDEPFLSLDAPAADRLRRLLLELWRRRPTTILFVTHDLREALFLADRILFLSPSPLRVVLDLPVELPRPRDAEGAGIEMLRRRLLDEHPDLLSGLIHAHERQQAEAET